MMRRQWDKPHLFWDKRSKKWLYNPRKDSHISDKKCVDWCRAQDKRWVPIEEKEDD